MSTTKQQEKLYEAFNGAYLPNSMDVQTGALWDSVVLAPGSEFNPSSSELFCTPMGKSLVDTNVTSPKRLDAPESFCVQRVVFTFSRDTRDDDLYAIAEQALWQLWIYKKRYLWNVLLSMQTTHRPAAPLRVCSFCSGVYANSVQCPGCGARDFILSTLGDGDAVGRQFSMDISPFLVIDNQAAFHVDWVCKPPYYRVKSPFKMWCHLEGLHARGVQ